MPSAGTKKNTSTNKRKKNTGGSKKRELPVINEKQHKRKSSPAMDWNWRF